MNASQTVVSPNQIARIAIWATIGIVAIWAVFHLVANLDAHHLMIIQNPLTGHLSCYTSPGPKPQWFGKVTKYNKRAIYKFNLPVRFNDGGHGTLIGSVQYEMPLDDAHLYQIQTKFGNEEAIQTQLIQTVVNKSVYMTGPTMSSRESFAEKRNYLINYVEDQIQNGIYKTLSKEVTTKDPLTNTEKTITVVDIVLVNGIPARQEEAVLPQFGIKTFNFAIERVDYEESVEKQIQQQQQITMKVQTAIAAAKEAEQNAITVAKQGEANAATAKWEQEVIKAKAVTEAQQQFEVATLHAKAAAQTKSEQILLGEGEAERKKLVMNANGALNEKLDAWLKAQQYWADAFAKFQGALVPTTVMGSGSANGGNAGLNFMEIIAAKAAKDLSLDLETEGKNKTK